MNHFHTESLPMINMLQKACEILVVHNHVELATEFNIERRKELLKEANDAEELVKHFQEVLKNNEDV